LDALGFGEADKGRGTGHAAILYYSASLCK